MKNTDFKFLVINTRTRWEEGYTENLAVSEDGITLEQEPLYILEQEIGRYYGGDVKVADVAIDDCSILYILDVMGHRVLTYDPSKKQTERLKCIGGEGTLPAQFRDPRGIALSHDTLYVADTGNNRIQAFARINLQIRWIASAPDSEEFRPVEIVLDSIGNLCVLDSHGHRILKFDQQGRFLGAFGEQILKDPVNIAIDTKYLFSWEDCPGTDSERLLRYLEEDHNISWAKNAEIHKTDDNMTIHIFKDEQTVKITFADEWGKIILEISDGEAHNLTFKEENGKLRIYDADDFLYVLDKKVLKFKIGEKDDLVGHEFDLEKLSEPSGLAVDLDGNVYVGDKKVVEGERFIHKYGPDGTYAGTILGYQGPCSGIVMDNQGNFYIIRGEKGEIGFLKYTKELRFIEQTYPVKEPGIFISKTLDSGEHGCRWHKTTLDAIIPDKTQIYVHHHISDEKKPQKEIIELPESEWSKPSTFHPSTTNLQDALIQGPAGRYLWLKLKLTSTDKYKTPKIRSIETYLPRTSYLRYLPAVYQEDAASKDFLERYLSLFETFVWNEEKEIGQITRYFDAETTPGEFISWFATWVAAIFDENWSEEKRRIFLQRAVELYKKRGTREGLEELIEIYTGNKPIIVENFQIYKKDAEDRFVLRCEENEEMKKILEKLFGGPASFSFCVMLKSSQKDIEKELKAIKRIIELEKPAHTTAEAMFLQPWIYLDMHTYLGVNTYISKQAMRLDITSVISRDTVLTDTEEAGQIERRSKTGIDTKLT